MHHSVTDFRPLRTWVDIISRLTLQRYKTEPRDVKRDVRFGEKLTFRTMVIDYGYILVISNIKSVFIAIFHPKINIILTVDILVFVRIIH